MLDPLAGRSKRSESSLQAHRGKEGVGWLDFDAQAGLLGQLQYPTPPLRARVSLDRHATYIVAAYIAGAAR
jgi:hypothetical protein